jgi:hypothetical protein
MTFSYDTFSSSPVIYCYMNTAPDIQFRDGYNIVYLDDMDALHRKIMQAVNAGELSCVFLPAQLTTIEASAFAGLNCEVIIIPESCRTIGSEAFANCRNLLYVYVPETVSEIAGDAFSGCTGIVDRR